jgi:RNA polymerase primary sigma factor
VSFDDLMQAGLLAVALAHRTWREDGGANFLTWIRRPVYFAMLELSREQKRRGGSFRGSGRGGVGRATAVLLSMDDYFNNSTLTVDGSGDRRAGTRDIQSLHEIIGTFEEPPDPFVRGRLPDLVGSLEKRERQVLRLRFEKELSYVEAGKQLGISRERVRQLEQKALRRLKAMMLNGEDAES